MDVILKMIEEGRFHLATELLEQMQNLDPDNVDCRILFGKIGAELRNNPEHKDLNRIIADPLKIERAIRYEESLLAIRYDKSQLEHLAWLCKLANLNKSAQYYKELADNCSDDHAGAVVPA